MQHLLQAGKDIYVPEIGKFSLESHSAELQPGSGQILAPSLGFQFQSKRFAPTSVTLRERLMAAYGIAESKAERMENEFIAEIQLALSSQRRYSLPDFGSLLADVDGNIEFVPEREKVQSSEVFGLRPVHARQLVVRHNPSPEKETPVVPLRPFDNQQDKKSPRWLILAAVSTGISLVAGSVFWLNSQNFRADQQAAIVPFPVKKEKVEVRKSEPTVRQAAQVVPQQVNPEPEIRTSQNTVPVENKKSTTASLKSEISVEKSTARVAEKMEETGLKPVETSPRFFVIAGSYAVLQTAKMVQIRWKKLGFATARHALTEKNMTRISIGRFESKEEALAFREKVQPGFTSSLWILSE